MILTAILFSFCALLVFGYSWFHKNFNYWHKRKIPNIPGVFSGSLGDIIKMKTNFGYHLKNVHLDPKFQNSPVVGIYAMHRPALLIRDPDLMKLIFIKHFDQFRNHNAKTDPQHDSIGCKALMFSRDKYWKNMRAKLSPVFTGGKLRQMYPLLQKVAENLEKHLQQRGDRFVAEMKKLAALYTIDNTNTTIFGIASNVLGNPEDPLVAKTLQMTKADLKQALHYTLIFFIPQIVGTLKARLFSRETEAFLKSTVSYIISERERLAFKRNDIIDVFVQLKAEALANGEDVSMVMEAITGLSWSFMFAGFDTSSTTLSHALLELAKNREVQDKLRQEIKSAFEENKGDLPYEALNSLEYLEMVINEATRMYPAVPLLDRVHNSSDEGELFSLKPYLDYTLPDGMAVFISLYGMHYDPKYWPNPEVFNPERFSKENKQNRHPMVFLPFGHGPRNCIGSRLGLLQVKIGLVHCLKNHYVQLCDQSNTDLEMDPRTVMLEVKGGITLEMINDNMCKDL